MATKAQGRPRSGSLYETKAGWSARLTVEVDGERVRRSVPLGTLNRTAAKLKLQRLLAEERPLQELHGEAKRSETFREAALRIVEASKIRSKANKLGRLKNHVFHEIGDKAVDKVSASDVRAILSGLAARGLSRDVVVHVRNDIGTVLRELWRDEVVQENVVDRVKLPEAKTDTRERAVLTDEELARYLGWQHPDASFAMGVLERQVMACMSRLFGGVRVGDLRALEWSALDTQGGKFESGWAPRKKTARPQLLEVPQMLRPILRDWWERHGRPTSGPVFPNRKGPRAGKAKGRGNVAAALRRDLKRAFGVEVATEVQVVRSNGRADVQLRWDTARELTLRERELFTETEFTKPVDFHSFRRAYKQALADAGVELQTAMALSGASDAKAHQRYLNNTAKMRRLPEAALPRFDITRAETKKATVVGDLGLLSDSERLAGGRNWDRTSGFNRVKVALYR